MRKISLGTGSHTTDSFDSVDTMDDNPLPPKSTRPRLKHLRLLLLSACAIAATACASLQPADHSDPALATAQAEAEQAMAQAKESMAAAEAAAAAQAEAEAAAAASMKDAEMAHSEAEGAMKDAEMARSEAEGAMKDAEMARSEAEGAMKDAEMARSEADAASDKLMMAMAPHPAEVMVSADQFDPSLLDMSGARASLAGPDSIYLSSIMYAGQPYSALLEYGGGTTATVAAIFGAHGKMIPDSVDLSRTRLVFRGPDKLVVADVAVGSAGYTGELTYVGGNTLQVTGLRGVVLPPTADEQIAALRAELAAVEAQLLEIDIAAGDARAQADAAMADADAARAEQNAAQLARSEAEIMAEDAGVAQWVAETEAAEAQAALEAMIADAFQPSAVMVADDQLDPSLGSLADARIAVAGPDSVYISSIKYGGQSFSALLKYTGGTTAEVRQVYGSAGKLIPDSVDLSQTELTFVAPNGLEVANVSVGGVGYSGTLAYTGDGKLQVTGIRQVALPPTALDEAQAALAQVEAALAASQADNAAMSDQIASLEGDVASLDGDVTSLEADLQAAQFSADEGHAMAAEAKATIDAMMADAYQPSAIMIADGQIDPSKASFADARVVVAGPDSVYVSSIRYEGQRFSALLRYTGGTTAEVQQIYGSAGKAIPDSVDLSQTELVFMSPNAWEISNVSVGGVGYSGTLAYTGDGKLQVTGISMVELPPTALEEAQAALAEVEAALAAAQADNAALEADLADAKAMADDSQAMADAAQASADMSMADADMAKAELEAMIADAFQPSAIAISDGQIDPSRASFADARIAIAGPDSVYVSSILYDGQRYSALLRYAGGTTAEVRQVFGSSGKLIPDSVDLSQAELVFVAPDAWEISNVSVGGAGYSGTLAYAGNGKLQVTGIHQVQLPPTTMDMLADAKADLEAALADASAKGEQIASLETELQAAQDALESAQAAASAAQAEADAAQDAADMANAEIDAMKMEMHQPSEVMISFADLDASLANFDNAVASLAGPDAVYVSNIMYAGRPYSALLEYAGGTTATVKQVFGADGKLIPDSVSLAQTEIAFRSPDTFAVANVAVGGNGYSGTLQYTGNGQLQVTGITRVTLPPTEAEMAAAAIEAANAGAAQMVSGRQGRRRGKW